MHQSTRFLMLLGLILQVAIFKAQVLFPNGKVMKLNTTLSVVYDETKIPFLTRGNKVTNFTWSHLYDSVPPNWFFMACMNGTCIGGIPDSGMFENLSAGPDSIGFVKFHVDFKFTHGRAVIAYVISNELRFGYGGDTVIFDLNYSGPLEGATLDIKTNGELKAYPNPSSQGWDIGPIPKGSLITLSDVRGQVLRQISTNPNGADSVHLDRDGLLPGIYWIHMNSSTGPSQNIRLVAL